MDAEEGRSRVTVGNDRAFTFDHVFGPASQQVCAQMFTAVVLQVTVASNLPPCHCTVP